MLLLAILGSVWWLRKCKKIIELKSFTFLCLNYSIVRRKERKKHNPAMLFGLYREIKTIDQSLFIYFLLFIFLTPLLS